MGLDCLFSKKTHLEIISEKQRVHLGRIRLGRIRLGRVHLGRMCLGRMCLGRMRYAPTGGLCGCFHNF